MPIMKNKSENMNLANKAIGKTPQATDSGIFYICPNCNVIISKYEPSHGKIAIQYCKWCGQKLEWGNH